MKTQAARSLKRSCDGNHLHPEPEGARGDGGRVAGVARNAKGALEWVAEGSPESLSSTNPGK